jgi:hypothetical protein
MVGLGRLELPTSRLSSARSNQLSYKPLTLLLTIRIAYDKDWGIRMRANDVERRMQSHKAHSPWRVFVREERETKTAKSRQWSSKVWRPMAPECF